jgi:VIT1/CCC1 family predicted Fe2+/Mn2+ transporter
MHPLHREAHLIQRMGWLRAAVLGANDGIISTASLMVGVAAASTSASEVLLAGIAGLVAGAMSTAAGEYVSVSSQAETENADLARERRELAEQPKAELDELTQIYVDRGVEVALARQVAQQMMAKDALTTHARDELGLSEHVVARPIQAALTSAATFAVGAALPLLIAIAAPTSWRRRPSPEARSPASPSWARSGHGRVERPFSSRPCGSRSGVRSRWRPPPPSVRSSGMRSSVDQV